MIRPSALTLARYCMLAPVLSERHPTRSEASDRGTEVDKQACAELEGGPAATDPDAREIVRWVRIRFSGAESDACSYPLSGVRTQVECSLYDDDTWGLITKGTADIVIHAPEVQHVAVIDIKSRGQWVAGKLARPDDNDQTHAYALAEARRLEADAYSTCLLLFGDGEVEPIWSRVYTPETWGPIYDRIREVNLRQTENPRPTSGPHCHQCYPRLHCPAWTLPAHEGPTALEPLTKPGGLTLETFPRALAAVSALEDVAEFARKQLNAFTDQNGGRVELGDGRAYRAIPMPGKRNINAEAMEADGVLEKYTKKGRPHFQYRITGRAK